MLTIPVAALLDRLSLVQIYVVATLVGALTVVYDIAARSYLPRFVPDASLGSANSKLTTDQAVSATLGPGLGGWLAGISSAAGVIFLNALGYFVSALALLRMRHREEAQEQDPAESRNLRRELVEGFSAVFRNPPVRAIALHAAIYNMGGSLVNVGFVVYFVRDLGMSQFAFGMVGVVGGVGAICGALGVPFLFDRIEYGKALLVALFFGTWAYFLLPAFAGPHSAVYLASAAGFFFGFGGSTAGSVIAVTVRQKVTPPELHARMNAAYRLVPSRLTLGDLSQHPGPGRLVANDIGRVVIRTAEPLAIDPYAHFRRSGSFLLIDPADGSTLTAGMAGDAFTEGPSRAP
ncbi:MFS transporter [Streptomyces niveus]|uniref:MFS transporter n=1 Tax=Streptomyces niveus TaxID=193462 RepID=UPI00368B7B56